MMTRILFILFALIATLFVKAQETETIPAPKTITTTNFPEKLGLVNDHVGILTAEEVAKLTTQLTDYQSKTKRNLYIVMVDDTKPYQNMVDYTRDLSLEWGLTPDDEKDLMIVLGFDIHDVRVLSSSENLEKLSLDFLNSVLNDSLLANFNEGKFYQGLHLASKRIMEAWGE